MTLKPRNKRFYNVYFEDLCAINTLLYFGQMTLQTCQNYVILLERLIRIKKFSGQNSLLPRKLI